MSLGVTFKAIGAAIPPFHQICYDTNKVPVKSVYFPIDVIWHHILPKLSQLDLLNLSRSCKTLHFLCSLKTLPQKSHKLSLSFTPLFVLQLYNSGRKSEAARCFRISMQRNGQDDAYNVELLNFIFKNTNAEDTYHFAFSHLKNYIGERNANNVLGIALKEYITDQKGNCTGDMGNITAVLRNIHNPNFTCAFFESCSEVKFSSIHLDLIVDLLEEVIFADSRNHTRDNLLNCFRFLIKNKKFDLVMDQIQTASENTKKTLFYMKSQLNIFISLEILHYANDEDKQDLKTLSNVVRDIKLIQ